MWYSNSMWAGYGNHPNWSGLNYRMHYKAGIARTYSVAAYQFCQEM